MRRDELSEDGATWAIPAERAKNHRKHVVRLAPLAREAVASAPRVEGPFVFTTTGRSPISGWSKAKAALDAAMLQVAREEAEAEGRDPGKVRSRRCACTTCDARALAACSGSARGSRSWSCA